MSQVRANDLEDLTQLAAALASSEPTAVANLTGTMCICTLITGGHFSINSQCPQHGTKEIMREGVLPKSIAETSVPRPPHVLVPRGLIVTTLVESERQIALRWRETFLTDEGPGSVAPLEAQIVAYLIEDHETLQKLAQSVDDGNQPPSDLRGDPAVPRTVNADSAPDLLDPAAVLRPPPERPTMKMKNPKGLFARLSNADSDVNPACSQCGGPHPFDTSVPSVVWNAVIRAANLPDYLCLTCIVRAFVDARQSFTAELVGKDLGPVPIEVRVNEQAAADTVLAQEENNTLRWRIRELESDGNVAALSSGIAVPQHEKIHALDQAAIRLSTKVHGIGFKAGACILCGVKGAVHNADCLCIAVVEASIALKAEAVAVPQERAQRDTGQKEEEDESRGRTRA